MPTYQYQCTDCGEALEIRQSFSDDALTVCPVCEGNLRKVFNAVGVVFKGSGFYRNDSRPKDSSSSSSDSSSNNSKSDAGKSSTEKSSTEKPSAKKSSTASSTSSSSSSDS